MKNFEVGDVVIARRKVRDRIRKGSYGWLHGEIGLKPFKITKIIFDKVGSQRKWAVGLVLKTKAEQALYYEDLELFVPQTKEEQLLNKIKQLWEKQDYVKDKQDE